MIFLDNKKVKYLSLLVLILIFGILVYYVGKSFSLELDNNVRVEPETELTYYLNVSYDGIDKSGVSTDSSAIAEVQSGYIFVEDKIPNGLEFVGFEETIDGTIGAYASSDSDDVSGYCTGRVVDDTNETTNSGKWNSNNTEYTYHGLHYNASTRTVSFQVKNLKAGCVLTVGVVTKTPKVNDGERKDFYNLATARESSLTVNSNIAHVFIGESDNTTYNVIYQYTGTIPSNAPSLPSNTSYLPGSNVGVLNNVKLEGYTFSGWQTTDVTVTNNSFTMPSKNVTLKGSFTETSKYQVNYNVTGAKPSNYVIPNSKEYYPDQTVDLGALKKNDVLNGYRFLGWSSTDVIVSDDNKFIMPSKNVTLTGSFEPAKYKITYRFYDNNLPYNSDSLLPSVKYYSKGEIVNLEGVKSVPLGYVFLGWYADDSFAMPEEDIVIYGEWKRKNGVFTPSITKKFTDEKNYYEAGDTVNYAITITNNENFDIRNVIVCENNKDVNYLAEDGYSVDLNYCATIDIIDPSESVTIYAKYVLDENDTDTILQSEIVGGITDNGYVLNGDVSARLKIPFASYIDIYNEVSSSNLNRSFQYKIAKDDFETYVSLAPGEHKKIKIASGNYTITEIVPEDYELTSISGAISTNGELLSISNGNVYNITFKNKFIQKSYYHSNGRVENEVRGDG